MCNNKTDICSIYGLLYCIVQLIQCGVRADCMCFFLCHVYVYAYTMFSICYAQICQVIPVVVCLSQSTGIRA